MRLPSSWPRVRYIFEHFGRLSCSEILSLGGPLGLYFLDFCDISVDIRTLFAELFRCFEGLQAKQHTDESLNDLEDRLILVLAELECELPFYWNSCVRHVLLHSCDFIRRCGPFKSHSMAIFERFHTVFKKLARSKGKFIMTNIYNNYCMLLNGDCWRQEMEDDGMNLTSCPMTSTYHGAKEIDYKEIDVKFKMKVKGNHSVHGKYEHHLQDLYAGMFPEYHALRERFRVSYLRSHPRISVDALSRTQIPRGWVPEHGPSLCEREIDWTNMEFKSESYHKVVINSKYQFRTEASQINNNNDDSCVKAWKKDTHGRLIATYGWIHHIFKHKPIRDGPTYGFFVVEWGKVTRGKTDTGLTQVDLDLNSRRPLWNPIILVTDIVPYNIALLPSQIEQLWLNQGSRYVVIDHEVKLGSHIPKDM